MVEIDRAQVRKEFAGRSCEMCCHGSEDTVGGSAMKTERNGKRKAGRRLGENGSSE